MKNINKTIIKNDTRQALKNIAFFDFDGTISKSDSLFLFVKFLVGKKRFYVGILTHIHILLGYLMGILSNHYAKERLSKYFFKGLAQGEFLNISKDFLPILTSIIKNSALKKIQWHQNRGDKVVIVSASFEEYLKPLCEELRVDCIGTTLEVINGKLSGKFATPNCYGKEKLNRILAIYNLSDYEKIYAYGDSRGDEEMLALALEENRFYRYFK
ncbi:HAD-IB family hydrolase [Helicobacter sp. 11S03491-1]|uniref:HAD family hydrolase n=1 Tax=Helicobacter sp. 11S03491-1 TaxID=1476196 RepID=UPI000BA6078D|nr:HAD-IB family hydrolase [Helicobacter sp. 11S03491-1]PAF43461.1 hypothetical protein BKH45_02205 [Helicobacter sp. 11S03491-1]